MLFNSPDNSNSNIVQVTTRSEVDTVGSIDNLVDYSGDVINYYVIVTNFINVLYMYPNNDVINIGFYTYDFSFDLQKYIL